MDYKFTKAEKINTYIYVACWLTFIVLAFFPSKGMQYGGMMISDVFLAFTSVAFIYQFLYPEKRRKPYHRVSMSMCVLTLFFLIIHFF